MRFRLFRRKRTPRRIDPYLEQEEAVRAQGFTFSGTPMAGFFGRVSTVRRVSTDKYGLCLFPSLDLVDAQACANFTTYARAVTEHPIAGLAPLNWWRADDEMMALIQGDLVQDDGHVRMCLRDYLLDRTLEPHEKEGVLIAMAHVLKKLHAMQLYHGFLLPRSLLVVVDQERIIRGIRVADGGLAYAFGPQKVYEQMERLKARDLGVDAYRRHRLLNELVYLSPEQKQKDRLHTVGPASDFYAFGSIAARLFAEVQMWGKVEIPWERVPEKWRPFIQACLSDNRPTDWNIPQ
jgi:hypothetical protein